MKKIRFCKNCTTELKVHDKNNLYCSKWCLEQSIINNTNIKKKIKRIKKVKVLVFPFKCRKCKKRIKKIGFCSSECRITKREIERKTYNKRKLSTG